MSDNFPNMAFPSSNSRNEVLLNPLSSVTLVISKTVVSGGHVKKLSA